MATSKYPKVDEDGIPREFHEMHDRELEEREWEEEVRRLK